MVQEEPPNETAGSFASSYLCRHCSLHHRGCLSMMSENVRTFRLQEDSRHGLCTCQMRMMYLCHLSTNTLPPLQVWQTRTLTFPNKVVHRLMTLLTSCRSLHWRLDPGAPLAHLRCTNQKLVNGFEYYFHLVELGGDAGLLPHSLFSVL